MRLRDSRNILLNMVSDAVESCKGCDLHKTRNKTVFGEGDPEAHIMFVGEAPGAEEDQTGRPFVGRAGKLLDNMIASMDLKREDIYICNTLKCRPPNNRNPTDSEQEACFGYLTSQILIVNPVYIVALGNPALKVLTGNGTGITKRCGNWEKLHIPSRCCDDTYIPVMPCFHPSALLRNPDWKQPAWQALQKVKKELDDFLEM